MSFSVRARGTLVFQLCRHFVLLRGSWPLFTFRALPLNPRTISIPGEVFWEDERKTLCSVELHAFFLKRGCNSVWSLRES